MDTRQNPLQAARTARAAVKHLDQLVTTHTLTEDDAKRLIKRIQDGFDAILGPEIPPPPPERGPFTVVHGGRP